MIVNDFYIDQTCWSQSQAFIFSTPRGMAPWLTKLHVKPPLSTRAAWQRRPFWDGWRRPNSGDGSQTQRRIGVVYHAGLLWWTETFLHFLQRFGRTDSMLQYGQCPFWLARIIKNHPTWKYSQQVPTLASLKSVDCEAIFPNFFEGHSKDWVWASEREKGACTPLESVPRNFEGHDVIAPTGQAQRLEKEFKKGPRA